MKTIALIGLNLLLAGLVIFLLTRRHLLIYHHQRRLWLTYLAIAVICWMDIFGSIFYAPPEAYRFIGTAPWSQAGEMLRPWFPSLRAVLAATTSD